MHMFFVALMALAGLPQIVIYTSFYGASVVIYPLLFMKSTNIWNFQVFGDTETMQDWDL